MDRYFDKETQEIVYIIDGAVTRISTMPDPQMTGPSSSRKPQLNERRIPFGLTAVIEPRMD